MRKSSLNPCGRSCLVIGGGGYIGSYLVPQLLATGRRVTILGRRQAPSAPLTVNTRYVQGSFSELALIQRLLDEHHEVIHLAYATVPNTSYDNPLGDLLENLPPTVQLFHEAAKRGNRLVLVSSGGTVYGEALSLPITEDHPTQPISPYGVTKLTLERYAFLYAATHGLQVVCVRPSNAYGEGQRPFIGQGFIATAMASAILERPVMVFGDHGGVRDYIHVSDLASGIVAALERGEIGKTYNLGSGQGYSTLDIIERLSFLSKFRDSKIQIIKMNARSFDVRKNVLDSSALKFRTCWEPRVDIESGLERTLEWMVSKIIRDE
jgi:UDP-glucose 4-epimerase